MIFQPEHIRMIRDGLKTQTRGVKRGIYQVGKDYAIQLGRGKKAVSDIRIVITGIWLERCLKQIKDGTFEVIMISRMDALMEGGYTPEEFEEKFREINPSWDRKERFVFDFHIIQNHPKEGRE